MRIRRREYRVNTLDIDRNKGIGIKIPFDPVNIFSVTYTTNDQIKSNLLNYMLTNKGERYFNPNFGADLRNMIFDQMTNLEEIKSRIFDEISLYFPSITIKDLTFTPNVDTSVLSIKLTYVVNNQEDKISIQIV